MFSSLICLLVDLVWPRPSKWSRNTHLGDKVAEPDARRLGYGLVVYGPGDLGQGVGRGGAQERNIGTYE